MRIERIVAGVDGSDNSVVALGWAADLAVLVDAEVVAVHALGLLERLDGGEAPPAHPAGDDVRRRFEEAWCAPLDRPGLRSRRVMREGPPPLVLLAVADEEGADLVVVGTRGVGDNLELLMGSTSTHVVGNAHCPVTVVPSGPGQRPGG